MATMFNFTFYLTMVWQLCICERHHTDRYDELLAECYSLPRSYPVYQGYHILLQATACICSSPPHKHGFRRTLYEFDYCCAGDRELNMRTFQVEASQSMIRIVGLSATLPNYKDVASFLGVNDAGLFYFDSSYRPVPLEMQFIGVTERNSLQARNIQDDICYDKVTPLSCIPAHSFIRYDIVGKGLPGELLLSYEFATYLLQRFLPLKMTNQPSVSRMLKASSAQIYRCYHSVNDL